MNKNNKKILIVIAVSIALFGIYFFNSQIKTKEISSLPDKILRDDISGEISVYDFMNKLRDEGKINFTEKNYAGMGKFIDSIDGIQGNGEKNWIYYVNDKKANIGVSNYKINMGDIVSWKYEKEI